LGEVGAATALTKAVIETAINPGRHHRAKRGDRKIETIILLQISKEGLQK
jgi:hypothetical protein